MTPHSQQQTTLIVGGTGKTGRRVVRRLSTRDIQVRVGSRRGEPPFDWEDRDTWEAVLRGVDSAYLTYYPDTSFPGASEAIGAFAEQAVKCGVRRLILLVSRGADESVRCEHALQSSGAEWTIVRASFFAQNFSEEFMLDAVRDGVVALPGGDTPEPFVDADDIADVVVAALTEDGHAGQVYELTGPRLLTWGEAVAEISKAAGREIQYVPITTEQFAAGMIAAGAPADFAEHLAELFGEVLDGRGTRLTDGVQRALGRPPKDFADYARETAATGVWSRP
jgi:uncharacterized protein YbjT (DUF2867 family)